MITQCINMNCLHSNLVFWESMATYTYVLFPIISITLGYDAEINGLQ